MKPDSEAVIQRRIVRAVRDTWPSAIVHHSTPPIASMRARIAAKAAGSVSGFPDLTVLMPGAGIVVFLEVKSAKGRVSPVQKALHERMALHGHQVAVVRSPEEALEVLDRAFYHQPG